jgi:hypothetical protein
MCGRFEIHTVSARSRNGTRTRRATRHWPSQRSVADIAGLNTRIRRNITRGETAPSSATPQRGGPAGTQMIKAGENIRNNMKIIQWTTRCNNKMIESKSGSKKGRRACVGGSRFTQFRRVPRNGTRTRRATRHWPSQRSVADIAGLNTRIRRNITRGGEGLTTYWYHFFVWGPPYKVGGRECLSVTPRHLIFSMFSLNMRCLVVKLSVT